MTQKNIIEFENWYIKTFPGMVFFNTGKHLNMFVRFLHREGYLLKRLVVRDLDTEVIGSKLKKKKHSRVYKDFEMKALIENAVTGRAETCITLYFDTGMRKMELLSGKIEDFNRKERTLNVWSAKNKGWRVVPLTNRAFRRMEQWVATLKPEDIYLFPQEKDRKKHIVGQYFDKDWVKTKIKARIKGKARVHDIRHTFATKTATDGWPIGIACVVLDMSSKEYLDTYVHVDPKDIRNWMVNSFG